MLQSEFQKFQAQCQHSYGVWQEHVNPARYKPDFTRVCANCMHVQVHSEIYPEEHSDSQTLVINHAPEVAFTNKLAFLIRVASTLVKQRPGLPVCYVAGKVTGLPIDEVQAKFTAKKIALEQKGFLVLNPCDFIAPDEDWQIAMRMASTLLCMSDHIFMLPCWVDSEGAKIEFQMAAQFGISTITE